MNRRQEADRTEYRFGGPERKQLDRHTLSQIRKTFSHGSAWITIGIIAMLVGAAAWFSVSPRNDTTVEGRVTNVAVTITDVVEDGDVRQERNEVATIEYVDTSGVTQRIELSGQGLAEGDTPSIAFDPEDPTKGRILQPLLAKFAIAGGLLGIPLIAFGIAKLIRR